MTIGTSYARVDMVVLGFLLSALTIRIYLYKRLELLS